MRRFFVDPQGIDPPWIRLSAEVEHHCRVLRLPEGAKILLLDGCGTVYHCTLHWLAAAGWGYIITAGQEREHALPVTLLQGLAKGERFDYVLQKATELGAARIESVLTQRAVPRPVPERLAKQQRRWQRIVSEAARQSRRIKPPEVVAPVSLKTALEGQKAGLRLCLWEHAEQGLADVLAGKAPEQVALLVGPEGGLTGEEALKAQEAGFAPVHLGQRVLRTETAGIAVLAILQYLFGDLAGRGGHGYEMS